MAKIDVLTVWNGQRFDLDNVELNGMTSRELVLYLVESGAISPESQLPASYDGSSSCYSIVDKTGGLIDPFDIRTLSQLGFVNGDTISIVIPTFKQYSDYTFANRRISFIGRGARKIREMLWYIAGAKIDIMRLCPDSYGRYAVIGTLVCLTAMMALLTGAYTAYTISGKWWAALLFAPIYAYIIFSIDRSFISGAPTEGWGAKIIKFFFRLVLAIMIGLIISTPVELMIFGGLVDERVIENHDKSIKNIRKATTDEIEKVNEKIKALNKELEAYDEKERQMEAEKLKYSSRSWTKRSDIDKMIKTIRDQREQWKATHQPEYDRYTEQINEYKKELEAKNNDINTIKNINDLITKYQAFLQLTKEDSEKKAVALLITFFFIFLEIVPMLTKLLNTKGSYEKLFIRIEQDTDRISDTAAAYNKIHKRVFGKDGQLDNCFKSNFGNISSCLDEEFHKAQMIYKIQDDMNHISRNNGY